MQKKAGNLTFFNPERCFIVAEAGSNHNGDIELGKKLIDSAKACGCDAVKFQAFRTEDLVTEQAGKADYQKGKSAGQSQFEMLKKLELSAEGHKALVEHAKKAGITLFYSVFDFKSADLVEGLGAEIFKLGSGELTNIPLIRHIARKGTPLILATGMGTDGEISDAVNAFRKENRGNSMLMLLNCSTGYPSRIEDSNLRRIKYLEEKFGVPCGNSDHTAGIKVSVLAAALGAPYIEKHFTVDKSLPGPDHPMSMSPAEMKALCTAVRRVEKKPVPAQGLIQVLRENKIPATAEEIEKILGAGDRKLSGIEKSQRIWARKSIVASADIPAGGKLTEKNIAVKRPEQGILPKHFEEALGKHAAQAIKKGTPVQWRMIE